jgi:predicted nucleic acid-binding protein
MMVLVDTPVWSLSLRRRQGVLNTVEQRVTAVLTELIREDRAQLIGPVRQELLSGIREAQQFHKLRDYLRAFEDPRLESFDYEQAAQMHNECRRHGIAGSPTDFLICAIAARRRWEVFTTDRDFDLYARASPLRLYAFT